MILEILFIATVFFAVIILFYRQAIEQYNILQIESAQLGELPKLLNEHTPLVLHEIGQPKLFTPDVLQTNKRLLQFPLGPNQTIATYLQKPNQSLALQRKASSMLAKESGLSVWANHTWAPKLLSYPFLQHVHWMSAEACLGNVGLRKTTGIVTMIYPTSGSFEITLMTEQQEKCLPLSWRGRFPEQFTVQDTPLVGEIKYITIKLRPGNCLCIPTHWFYSVRAADQTKPALWAIFTLDNPVSSIASFMENHVNA